MATYTTNYNLSKPDANDNFEDYRQTYNQNMDIIDQNLGGGGGGSSTLAGLNDVTITSAQNGQILEYDSGTSKWKNVNKPSGGDTVSWNQIQASGTKIAEIDINGTSQNVYAPNGGGGGNYYGVFIDPTNEIVPKTTYNSAVGLTYTATQDCVVCADLISDGNTFPNVTIDNKWIGLQFQNTLQQTTYQFFLKKGQTLNISASVSDNVNYVIYGLVGGSSGGGAYTAGEGINIDANNEISLAYLTVVNGAVNLVYDDGN